MAKLLRVPLCGLQSGELQLSKEITRYVSRVHRLGEGDQIILFDPEHALEAVAVILGGDSPLRCQVEETRAGTKRGFSELGLYQGIGKGQKLEQVIRDATALGVGEIQPVVCERGVVKLDPDSARRSRSKSLRWRTIALEAARQSERSDMPELQPPRSFVECLSEFDGRTAHFLLDPLERDLSLLDALAVSTTTPHEGVALWIGPEGGFSQQEREALLVRGARAVSLGELVLRTETAAVAALSIATAVLSRRRKP